MLCACVKRALTRVTIGLESWIYTIFLYIVGTKKAKEM